jgi:hypothetical protein
VPLTKLLELSLNARPLEELLLLEDELLEDELLLDTTPLDELLDDDELLEELLLEELEEELELAGDVYGVLRSLPQPAIKPRATNKGAANTSFIEGALVIEESIRPKYAAARPKASFSITNDVQPRNLSWITQVCASHGHV